MVLANAIRDERIFGGPILRGSILFGVLSAFRVEGLITLNRKSLTFDSEVEGYLISEVSSPSTP